MTFSNTSGEKSKLLKYLIMFNRDCANFHILLLVSDFYQAARPTVSTIDHVCLPKGYNVTEPTSKIFASPCVSGSMKVIGRLKKQFFYNCMLIAISMIASFIFLHAIRTLS